MKKLLKRSKKKSKKIFTYFELKNLENILRYVSIYSSCGEEFPTKEKLIVLVVVVHKITSVI